MQQPSEQRGGVRFFPDIVLFQSAVGIITVSIPPLLHRGLGWRISLPLILLYYGFILGTVFFGEILGFYYKFPIWDDIFHFIGAYLCGILGFFLFGKGHGEKPVQRLFFSLFFAVFSGVLWEIVEYFSDGLFATNMQKYGLIENAELIPLVGRAALSDTMNDLILDLCGASFFVLCQAAATKLKKGKAVRIFSIELI